MTSCDMTYSVISGEATGGHAKTTIAFVAYEKSAILRNGCGKMCAQVLKAEPFSCRRRQAETTFEPSNQAFGTTLEMGLLVLL